MMFYLSDFQCTNIPELTSVTAPPPYTNSSSTLQTHDLNLWCRDANSLPWYRNYIYLYLLTASIYCSTQQWQRCHFWAQYEPKSTKNNWYLKIADLSHLVTISGMSDLAANWPDWHQIRQIWDIKLTFLFILPWWAKIF